MQDFFQQSYCVSLYSDYSLVAKFWKGIRDNILGYTSVEQ